MGKQGEFEFAGSVAAEQAADYLERIAAGLRAGQISLGAGERRLSLAPGEMLKLEVEAESEGGKGSVALELSWKPADAPTPTLEILAEPLQVGPDDDEAADESDEEPDAAEKHRPRRRS